MLGRWLTFTALAWICATPALAKHHYKLKHDAQPKHPISKSQIKDAIPKAEPKSIYGNPESYIVQGHRYFVLKSAKKYKRVGYASWYGEKFSGFATSNHEIYDPNLMTAASRELPLPTYVKVTNLENKKTVIVRVNDRGPFNNHRIIDLSYAAALKLDMLKKGTAKVQIEAIDPKSQDEHKTKHNITSTKWGSILAKKVKQTIKQKFKGDSSKAQPAQPTKTPKNINTAPKAQTPAPSPQSQPHTKFIFPLQTFDSPVNAKQYRQKLHGHTHLPLALDCTPHTCTVALGPLDSDILDHKTKQWLLEMNIKTPLADRV